jgi:hypothetical protein
MDNLLKRVRAMAAECDESSVPKRVKVEGGTWHKIRFVANLEMDSVDWFVNEFPVDHSSVPDAHKGWVERTYREETRCVLRILKRDHIFIQQFMIKCVRYACEFWGLGGCRKLEAAFDDKVLELTGTVEVQLEDDDDALMNFYFGVVEKGSHERASMPGAYCVRISLPDDPN